MRRVEGLDAEVVCPNCRALVRQRDLERPPWYMAGIRLGLVREQLRELGAWTPEPFVGDTAEADMSERELHGVYLKERDRLELLRRMRREQDGLPARDALIVDGRRVL